jgi:hypothetical protein
MKPIPLVNKQALGRTFTVPAQGPLSKNGQKPALGQYGPTIGGDEIGYRDAVMNLEGVKKSYPKLIALLGQEQADKVLAEAQAAVEKTQAEYMKSIPQK